MNLTYIYIYTNKNYTTELEQHLHKSSMNYRSTLTPKKEPPPAWPKLQPLPHQLQQRRPLRQLAGEQRGGCGGREVHRLAALVLLRSHGGNGGVP